MVSNNITDYELYTDPTNNRIIVRFPWKSDEEDFDPEAAIDELAATAQLTFREGMEYEDAEYADDGSVVYKTPAGTTAENIILEGSDVVSAEPAMTQDESTGEYKYIVLSLIHIWCGLPPRSAIPDIRPCSRPCKR